MRQHFPLKGGWTPSGGGLWTGEEVLEEESHRPPKGGLDTPKRRVLREKNWWGVRSSRFPSTRPGGIGLSAAFLFSTIARRLAQALGTVVVACGLLAAARIAEAFYAEAKREGAVMASSPSLARFAEGDMVARVTAPRIGLDFPVLEGVESATLAAGPGHLPGTALPGEDGGSRSSLIAVPRDSGLRSLSDLRLGDLLEMKTPFGSRRYSVAERLILSPEDIRLEAWRRPGVTFLTPFPADSLGPAPLRLAIVAEERVPWLSQFPLSSSPGGFSLFPDPRVWPSERSGRAGTAQLFNELGNAINRSRR